MNIEATRQYISAVRERYKNSTKTVKSLILNEFIAVVGCSRKHAIRALNGTVNLPGRRKVGRPPKYQGADFVNHMMTVWEAMGRVCSKKLIAALPEWLPHYSELTLGDPIRAQLLKISPATVDRVLKPHKKSFTKGKSTTQASLIKNHIPIELLTQKITSPGFIEADTVAHCGGSISGSYFFSLTLTDLYTGWTENRATWTKQSEGVIEQIRDIERSLPFEMKGFACDNGSEFLNYELWNYFKLNRKDPIQFVRRRPYKKNDNAHVEQKNWTHVRQLFGYERIDARFLQGLMNEIYKGYWNLLQNHFIPCFKLSEKTRVGSKMVKKYGPLKTPYQRILESPDISEEVKKRLKSRHQSLNPFLLKKSLDSKLNLIFKLLHTYEVKNVA